MLESLKDGALIIEVHMKLVDPTEPPARFIPENPFACEAIRCMFMDDDSADVVIEVKGRNFHVHRFVVQKCSTILADADLLIQLSNVSPDIFRHLLYMYGGKIEDAKMKLHPKEIIDAADLYGVVNLKLDAEVRFVEATIFTMENVLDHLEYAESMNLALLIETAMKFIVENKIEAPNTLSFKDAPKRIVNDLLVTFATGEGNSNNELNRMPVDELRRDCLLQRLDFEGSRDALIAALKNKQRSSLGEFVSSLGSHIISLLLDKLLTSHYK
jgi:hypothetical protein